jgi:hypothetical protein
MLVLLGLVVVLIPPAAADDAQRTGAAQAITQPPANQPTGAAAPAADRASASSSSSFAEGMSSTRLAAVTLAALAALAEAAWITATVLAGSRDGTPTPKRRRAKAARWLVVRWPLRPLVGGVIPSYQAEASAARAQIDANDASSPLPQGRTVGGAGSGPTAVAAPRDPAAPGSADTGTQESTPDR